MISAKPFNRKRNTKLTILWIFNNFSVSCPKTIQLHKRLRKVISPPSENPLDVIFLARNSFFPKLL